MLITTALNLSLGGNIILLFTVAMIIIFMKPVLPFLSARIKKGLFLAVWEGDGTVKYVNTKLEKGSLIETKNNGYFIPDRNAIGLLSGVPIANASPECGSLISPFLGTASKIMKNMAISDYEEIKTKIESGEYEAIPLSEVREVPTADTQTQNTRPRIIDLVFGSRIRGNNSGGVVRGNIEDKDKDKEKTKFVVAYHLFSIKDILSYFKYNFDSNYVRSYAEKSIADKLFEVRSPSATLIKWIPPISMLMIIGAVCIYIIQLAVNSGSPIISVPSTGK